LDTLCVLKGKRVGRNMKTPGSPGEILRAIAKSYQDEIGPARAEQLVNRAMARAGGRSPRFKTVGVLVASGALGLSVLALGLIVLLGNSDPANSGSQPVTPVASAPIPAVQAPDTETVASSILPTEELEEALALLEQQLEMEAANVVIRALGPIFLTAGGAETPEELVSPTSTTIPKNQRTSSWVGGAVPPEQSSYPQGASMEDGSESPGSSENDPSLQESESQQSLSDSQPTIEELGQALRVEVEELLSADPTALAEAAEGAREAAQQITEYVEEPTILLPSDEDDDR
jgi:hypothetical protein